MAGARSGDVPVLRGRRDELAVLDTLLDGARAGRSGVLVLRGEAGIGKTALLEHAIESASDFTLLRAVGVESEMELAFAALHQLCAPVDDFVHRLPAPQRDALGVTFGVRAGAAPDRFLIALATLSLFSEAAHERPLLCVIDDAQWLDRASAQVLGFIARRLLAEPVALLFAARETTDAFADLPELLIEGLDEAEARKLLASVIPGRLDDRVGDQLVAEARGNPLALLELPRGLSPAQLAGGFALPAVLSLAGRMEQSFLQRLKALPENTQRLLLVAAAEPLGDPALLWRAADRLEITDTAREPAESAGLIEIDDRVRFRHSLVRSAVYRAAPAEQRRRAHRALAEATDAGTEPDRRAWHLAAATAGPDEDVAAELERAAGRAQARGGLAAAAAFLQRAAELTPEPGRSAHRAFAAAQTSFEAGALDDALALLATADTAGDLEPAHVHLLRAQIAFAARRGSDAPPLLLTAARELEPVDPPLARATYLNALAAALFAGRLARGASALEVAQAVRDMPPSPQPPHAEDLLLSGLALHITDGPSVGTPVLKRALRGFRDGEAATDEGKRGLWLAGRAAGLIWDDESWDALSARQVQAVRDVGALTMLPFALSTRAGILLFAGGLPAAASLLEEAEALSSATLGRAPYSPLTLAAFRGRKDELKRQIETSKKDFMARGEGMLVTVAEWATAVLSNGLARYEDALRAAEQAAEYPHELWFSNWVAVELIEAASRTGEVQRAADAMERLSSSARASGSDWGLGVEARSRALLSDGDAAEGVYREAIERLQRTRLRVDLARAQLVYGEWLRRERRRLDAASTCAPRSRCSEAWAWTASPGAPSVSCRPRGNAPASAPSTRAKSSRRRKLRLPAWPATASRTPPSGSSCSSGTPSPTTCARSSPSSTSRHATSSARRCPADYEADGRELLVLRIRQRRVAATLAARRMAESEPPARDQTTSATPAPARKCHEHSARTPLWPPGSRAAPMSAGTRPRPSIVRRPSAAALRAAHGGGNRRTIIVAFSGNVVIAAAKLVAALITGSSAMLAETFHSTADCVNQLMLGLSLRGRHKPPDADHPFGYQAAGFLWAFLATLASFLVGGCLSIVLAIHQLTAGGDVEMFVVAWAVLGVAGVADALSFAQGLRQAKSEAAQWGVPRAQWVRQTSEPIPRAILVEDGAALIGDALLAGGLLTHQLGGPAASDGVAALLIGLLLAATAVGLARPLADLLIGRSILPPRLAKAQAIVAASPAVEDVVSLYAVFAGPQEAIVAAKVHPVPNQSAADLARSLDEIDRRLRTEMDEVGEVFIDVTSRGGRAVHR
jgi:cation diffusion facilitator family transporter